GADIPRQRLARKRPFQEITTSEVPAMLPLEDLALQDIAKTWSTELATSRELLQLGLDVLGCDEDGKLNIRSAQVAGVGDNARSLALGLYAKACKQFRAIIILAERGFGGELAVLTRSLFETTLALAFIITEQVILKRGNSNFDLTRRFR